MPEVLNIPIITMIFIVLDIASGMAQAFANKNVSSEKLRQGLFHKMAFIFAIALGYLIEYAMGYMNLGFDAPIAIVVCVYVCLTEIISIVENITLLNPELRNTKFLELFNITTNEEQ